MRWIISMISAMLVLVGCARAETPVDMVYRVSVETTKNTCDEYTADRDVTILVDAYLQSDGRVTFTYERGMIPGFGEYPDITILDGRVDHTYNITGQNLTHELSGILTPEEIDLTLTINGHIRQGDGIVRCVEKARIKGVQRPMFDSTVLDGKYRVRYDYHGRSCPDAPSTSVDSWNVPLDIDPYKDGLAVYSFDERDQWFIFGADMPTDGVMDWHGTIYLILDTTWISELEGHVTGTLRPDLVDLAMEYWDPVYDADCTYLLEAHGQKLIPSPDQVDNDYRLAYTTTDACFYEGEEPKTETFDGQAEIVSLDDGDLHLLQGNYRIRLHHDEDGRVWNMFESASKTATLTFEGKLVPPHFELTYEYQFLVGDDEWCPVTYHANGHVRYFLEEDPGDESETGEAAQAMSVRKGASPLNAPTARRIEEFNRELGLRRPGDFSRRR